VPFRPTTPVWDDEASGTPAKTTGARGRPSHGFSPVGTGRHDKAPPRGQPTQIFFAENHGRGPHDSRFRRKDATSCRGHHPLPSTPRRAPMWCCRPPTNEAKPPEIDDKQPLVISVGDSHMGPFITGGNPFLQNNKNAKQTHQRQITTTARPTPTAQQAAGPDAPSGKLRLARGLDAPSCRTPPRSRLTWVPHLRPVMLRLFSRPEH
jgi:hypothetical protein